MILHEISADRDRIYQELNNIGVDKYALNMVEKGISINILVKDIKSPAANILKQEAIASGMDAAVKRGVISCSVEYSDVLLLGNRNNYFRLIKRLSKQPFNLKSLSENLLKFLSTKKRDYFISINKKYSISIPMVMGILNVTPDSFSDGGKYNNIDLAKIRIDEMIKDGVDIIDVGGISTRPNAENIEYTEEIDRIDSILEYASKKDILVSVDTFNYKTAEFAINKGVKLINDISGLSCDNMAKLCGESNVAVCIMHNKGYTINKKENISYNNVFSEIKNFFYERIEKALKYGIKEESIILDVGFGFSKNKKYDFLLLKYLKEFNFFGMPLLSGLSRKSMIGISTSKDINDRLAGTIAANAAALLAGSDILRVHDVKECVDTISVINSIIKAE